MFVIIGDKARATSRSSTNLCVTCHNYSAARYALDDQEVRECMSSIQRPRRLRGPVSDCTDYADKTRPNRHEMNKIAWIVEPSKREVGFGAGVKFVSPSERKDLRRDD